MGLKVRKKEYEWLINQYKEKKLFVKKVKANKYIEKSFSLFVINNYLFVQLFATTFYLIICLLYSIFVPPMWFSVFYQSSHLFEIKQLKRKSMILICYALFFIIIHSGFIYKHESLNYLFKKFRSSYFIISYRKSLFIV